MISKNIFSALFAALLLVPALAEAGRAEQFKGWYEIRSQADQRLTPSAKDYFIFDTDTLGVIWAKYAEGPLPENLEHLRNEPTIMARFTNRMQYFFGLEGGALIGNSYIVMEDSNRDRFELMRRPDGNWDLAVKVGERLTIYSLGPPQN